MFDNDVTAKYKMAASLKIPVKYTYTTADGKLAAVFSWIVARTKEGKSLMDVYRELDTLAPNLGAIEIAMLYTHMQLVAGVTLTDILPVVNKFYSELNQAATEETGEDETVIKFPLIDNEIKLTSEREAWYATYLQSLQKDLLTVSRITSTQEQLAAVKNPLPITNVEISKVIMNYTPIWKNGAAIDVPDGIEIFDKAVPSFLVPYIQYNDNTGKRYYRVFHGIEEDKDIPPFHLTIQQPTVQTSRLNVIYLTVWMGKPGTVPITGSYVRCIYTLEDRTIKIPCPDKASIKMMTDRVTAALPLISLSAGRENRIRATFDIDQIEVVEPILHYMILTDDRFSIYLYIDESSTARIEKKKSLNIHYKTFTGGQANEEPTGTGYISNASSVTVTFGHINPGDTEDTFSPLPGFIPEPERTQETSMINVNVTKARSEAVLNQFLEVFRRLMRIYMNEKDELERYFNYVIPGSIPARRLLKQAVEQDEEEEEKEIEEAEEAEEGLPLPGEEIVEVKVPSAQAQIRIPDQKTKNANLKKLAPEVFLEGDARKCQCRHQPIIIKRDEIKEWENLTFVDKGGVVKRRQVMMFPPPPPNAVNYVPRWFFVCPNDNIPYPALKKNDAANSKEFPLFPCCAVKDQLANKKSKYYTYYKAKTEPAPSPKPKETTKQNYRMNTDKIQEPGREANIPAALADLLRTGMGGKEDFIRLGIPISPGALIHCVALAVPDPAYIERKSVEAREEYVTLRRQQIAQLIKPLTYKQELYDMDTDEITRRVYDDQVFLDPYLFYRGVEELFNVNIFVFNPTTPLQPITGVQNENTQGPILEVPRSKLAHIRVPRLDRKTVLILKHWGAETNPLKFPHCELIMSKGQIAPTQQLVVRETLGEEGGEEPLVNIERPAGEYGIAPGVTTKPTMIFDRNMTAAMLATLSASFHAYVFSFPRSVEEKKRSSIELEVRDDPYSRINWVDTFKDFKIINQQVDGYGKLRVLGVEVEGKIVSIILPPSQPLNLPELKAVTSSPEAGVRRLLGDPSGITRIGLWYEALDYTWAIFVPTAVQSEPDRVSPPPPINIAAARSDLRDPINDIRSSRRYANILMQLINWCWRLDKGQTTLQDWWNKWVVKDTSPAMKRNGQFIPPTRIIRRLPVATSTLEGLTQLTNWWPPYFMIGGAVALPGEKKAPRVGLPLPGGEILEEKAPTPKKSEAHIHLYPELYSRALAYFLNEEKLSAGLPLTDEIVVAPTHLTGLYIVETDFTQIPKSIVFIDADHLYKWVLRQARRGTTNTLINPILHKVTQDMWNIAEPFIYRDANVCREDVCKTYIIQNVKEGNIQRALKVDVNWHYRGINTGVNTLPNETEVDIDELPHAIYGISKSQTLVCIEKNTGGHNFYLQFLRFGSNPESYRYAAMLPIL